MAYPRYSLSVDVAYSTRYALRLTWPTSRTPSPNGASKRQGMVIVVPVPNRPAIENPLRK